MNDDLYRGVTDFAQTTPTWLHTLAEYGTDGGVVVLWGLLVVAWWRARHGDARAMALALLVPAATAVAYLCSEIIKLLVEEERPCRAVTDAAASLAPCPEVGDWSFPSNHSTVAVGAAVGLVLVWRATAWFALPLAALMVFSRVFVGVHYPLDVTAGAALGTLLVILGALLGVRPVTTLVIRLRKGPLGPLLGVPGVREEQPTAPGRPTGDRARGGRPTTPAP